MTEAEAKSLAALTAGDLADRIANEIEAYELRDGPDLEDVHLKLVSDEDHQKAISGAWAGAKARRAAREAKLKALITRKIGDPPKAPTEPKAAPEAVILSKAPATAPEAEAVTEAEPSQSAPAAPGEENYIEDDTNAANNIRRTLWRLAEALAWIKPDAEMLERVGSILWRLSAADREAGGAIWVKWLKKHCDDEAGIRAHWAKGFEGAPWCKVDELYEIAQRKGWRYPNAVNHNRLEEVVERSEKALVRVGADLYQSGGKLVRPVSKEVDATKGRKTRIARLVEIDGAFLKAELSRYVDFFTRGKDEARKPAGPPQDVVQAMLSRYGKWTFPTITGIICAPTLRRDGTVLASEGFDAASELLVMGPLPEMPTVPKKPTQQDARNAIGILDKLFDEFPFVDRASRSVALSGVLSTVCRPALSCVPMHAASAPAAGTGKSFLWDLIAAVAIGDAMPVIAAGANLEETAKKIDAQVIKGLTLLSIDNSSIHLGGDEMCQVVERPAYVPRILGKSLMKEQRNVWTIFATGNNLRLKDDITRRSLLVRLDAGVERPEMRTFRGNPFDAVLGNRGTYLWAALTVALAYRAAGMPDRLPRIGDPFAEWSDQIRSALVWLGYDDPVLTMEAVRDNDPSRQARVAMFQAMANAYGVGSPRPASQMVADAKNGTIKLLSKKAEGILDQRKSAEAVNLKAALIQYTDNRLDAKYLGNKLNVDRGMIAGGLCLHSAYDSHTKVNHWYVEGIATEGRGA